MTDIELDSEGYLKDLADWSEPVALSIARSEGLDLTQSHWEIINLLRDVHREFEHTPITRVFVKLMGQRLGRDKGSSLYLLRHFPETPMRKACKIAGLPKPTNCL